MPSIEERLQALERLQTLEQEHTQLKKTIELQTIAIGALVNKAALEKLNEKYDKIFDALMTHDRLTNERLGDIQNQLIDQDGKIVGLQTEMRQCFNEQDNKSTELRTTQTEHTALLTQILARLPENPPSSK
jgi:chromosome segregation ATPase